MQLHPIHLDLDKKQMLRVAKGHRVRVLHSQIGKGHVVHVPKKLHTKALKAHAERKGFNLQLTVPELKAQGAGFLDKLKEAGSWLKKNVFDQPLYKEKVAPIIRTALKEGVNRGVSTFAGPFAPELGALANKGVDLVGSKTGAFGIKRVKKSGGRLVKGSASAIEWGRKMKAIREQKQSMGGSFRPAGSY